MAKVITVQIDRKGICTTINKSDFVEGVDTVWSDEPKAIISQDEDVKEADKDEIILSDSEITKQGQDEAIEPVRKLKKK